MVRARCIEVKDASGNTAVPDNRIGNTVIESKINIKQSEYSDESLIIVIKTYNEETIEYSLKDTVDKINNEELYITNLDIGIDKKVRLHKTISTFAARTLYNCDKPAVDRAVSVIEKSKLLGACPADEKGYIQKGFYDQVTISDLSSKFKGSITAKTIYFIGSDIIENMSPIRNLELRCARAVIKNPCVVYNLVPKELSDIDSDIIIRSNDITISHTFLDINTPAELLDLYDAWYKKDLRDKCSIWDKCYIAFNKNGVDLQKLKDEIMNIISVRVNLYRKGELDIHDCASTLHWVCDMWHSTDNNFCEILTSVDEIAGIIGDYKNVIESSVYKENILKNLKAVLDRYLKCLGEV